MTTIMKSVNFTLFCALRVFAKLTASVQASGLWLYEQGTPDLGDADIDRTGGILRGDLQGKYKKNHIHFLGVNLNWKF
jgi:hypothetical protein